MRGSGDWLHETAGPGRATTLLVVLHGSKAAPEDEAQSWRRAARARGWDLLSYGHGDADMPQARLLQRDLQSIVRRIEQDRGKPYKTVYYAGSSRGGRLAVELAGLSRASAAVSMGGAPDGPRAAVAGARVLLVFGQHDPLPEAARLKAEGDLRSAGYAVTSRRRPGQGHLLDETAYEDAVEWLESGAGVSRPMFRRESLGLPVGSRSKVTQGGVVDS